jgi:CRISPR-associated protein Cas2
MFVMIVGEYSQDDHKTAVRELLKQYGLKEVISDVFESVSMKENTLARLKRDVDRVTDYYDTIRFYQYPLDDTLAVTSLTKKKWRRILVKA